MAESSVGTISLDLVIQDNISQQLEKIQNTAMHPAQKIGGTIQESIQKPIEKTAENMQDKLNSAFDNVSKSAEKSTESINNSINNAVQRATENMKKQQIEVDVNPRVVKSNKKSMQYDTKAIEKEVDGYFENMGGKANTQIKNIFDKLKSFKIPTTSIERLETELETTRTKSELLKSEWEKLSVSEPSEKLTSKMLKLQQQIISTDKSAERLENELQRANNLENGVITGEYQAPEKPIERLQRQFELTNQKIESVSRTWQQLKIELQSTNDTQTAEKIRDKLIQTENQLISLTNTADKYKQKITESGSETTSTVDSQFQKIFKRLKKFKIPTTPIKRFKTELQNTQVKVDLLQKKWQELSAEEPSQKVIEQMLRVQEQIVSAQSKAESLKNKIADLGNSGHKLQTIKKFGKSVFNGLKAVGNQALDSLRKRFGFLNKSAVSLTKPIKKLGITLKNTFRRVFVMATLYAAVKALKKSISSVMKQNEELSKSLNEVKANLAIAFTPILQAVMPALNTMMSGLARATKYIAGFISGLFGMTYKQAAEATKKLYNTGKQAENTAKKAKMSLAGFDEMNILSIGTDDESKNEKDTGINYDNLDMSEPVFPDWAESLKEAIKNGDWYSIGEILAERVNFVFSGIDWKSIEKKINNKINNICNLFNGFIDNIDFKTIGDSFAGGINVVSNAVNTFSNNIHWNKLGSGLAKGLNQTVKKINWGQLGRSMSANVRIITNILYNFVTETDWEGLGDGIGEAVNGWFDGIDFGKLAETLASGIIGIFNTITATLQTIDFSDIGQKIAEFVNNINIPEILSQFASSVSSLITELLDFLISFISTVDWSKPGEQIVTGISKIVQSINWTGIIENVFKLLGEVIGGSYICIANVLYQVWEIFKKAWNSVKEYFNNKIEECGGNIILGILKGIVDGVKNIAVWIKEHIFKPFIDGFKKMFEIHSPSKVMVEFGGFIIDGLFKGISDDIKKVSEVAQKVLNAIKNVFTNVGNWFKEKFSSAWDGVKNVWNNVKGYFSNVWTGVKETFTFVGDWFSEKFDTAVNGIKKAFSGITGFFKYVWNGITGVFSHVTNWFKDTFSNAWEAVKNVFSKGGEIFTGITDGIFETFKSIVNGLIDGINWVIEQPFNAINWALDGIRDIEIAGWYPFEWLPSIDTPQIPHLAKGGLATAPTLAMVGDNANASVDPEVIAPLSKLKGIIGSETDNSEIIFLMKEILNVLQNTITVAQTEKSVYLYPDSKAFSRLIIKIIRSYKERGGSL